MESYDLVLCKEGQKFYEDYCIAADLNDFKTANGVWKEYMKHRKNCKGCTPPRLKNVKKG